jgi:hypothetical protein
MKRRRRRKKKKKKRYLEIIFLNIFELLGKGI